MSNRKAKTPLGQKPTLVALPASGHCNTQIDYIRALRKYVDDLEASGDPTRSIVILREDGDGILERYIIADRIDKARTVGILTYGIDLTINGP